MRSRCRHAGWRAASMCISSRDREITGDAFCWILCAPAQFDSTEEELKGLDELVFRTKKYLDRKYKPTGYNIGINSGEDSGQTVFHLHIHLIPRYKGDVEDPKGGVRGVIPSKQKY